MAYRITHIRQYTRSRALNLTATNHSAAKSLLAGRVANMKLLRENASDIDLLIIGGGATGSGAALDAALRGLKVACIEREDFSSGTSSRSTKLLWGGSRYLVQAFISLLSSRLVARPIQTVKNFITDFRMVLNCHRERRFLLEKQPHLTKWMPIAVPLARWVLWPPPFGFIPAALGPLGIFPLFFKFYDALSSYSCPPSHIMGRARARRKFPQLAVNEIKYCPVFYEGIHDDARTNLAVAQTAAREGAIVANYCEAVGFLHGAEKEEERGRVVGVIVRDVLADEMFEVRAKSVLLCGGPFTDDLRRMQDPECGPAVNGASGIHIVLPAYFAPTGIGLVDMNTSDGRFMFFLPWKDHVVVGTTDHKCSPTMRPIPDEAEIKWLLHEASKYLSPELRLRRQDVLSAWSGIRPLAVDPHASSTATASRDHVISFDPKSGIVFVSGGKWTTYREMAEDAVDKIIAVTPTISSETLSPCRTLSTHLVGFDGYSVNLPIRLVQDYGISIGVARHLVDSYAGRAEEVLSIAKELAGHGTGDSMHRHAGRHDLEVFLAPGFPIIEAEVVFAARFDWAVRAEDFLARRTRLAFLNKDAAIVAIPRVVQLMGEELHWTPERQQEEVFSCLQFMRHFGGTKEPMHTPLRLAARADLMEVFNKAKGPHTAGLNRITLLLASEMLGYSLSEQEVEDCIQYAKGKGVPFDLDVIVFEVFEEWWNSDRCNEGLRDLKRSKLFVHQQVEGTGALFG